MDKEILALIGKLYIDIYNLTNYSETLKSRIQELENRLDALGKVAKENTNSSKTKETR